jgi:pyruvate/2-oxoglutarate dehydrogenase complex dihydrolipoamide acyltransferase (E2) component
MDTQQGLLVPIIKQVQSLTIYEIAQELNRLIINEIKISVLSEDRNNGQVQYLDYAYFTGTDRF